MSVDDASRAVQHWPVGERGMSEMRSGTARYHFITWRACASKYDRAQVRQALQTPPEKQIRTYLCVYCGQFAVNISRHLQAFNEKGKKGCNMRFVDDCSLRTHISSIAAASAASAGTKPRSHLENVHANLTGQMTEMRQALEEQTQAQAAHRQAVRAQTALSQDANTSLAAAVLSVKRKVDVLVPDEEQLKCMACSDDVPATDAVRCDADAQKEHSVCQTCFVEQSEFDLSQRECKCQVFNCGGKLRHGHSADSIEENPGAADSGIRRACAHNAMNQLAWIVRLCVDYVDWDLKHTRFKHGDDEAGFVGYVLEEDHPLVRLGCIKPSAMGSRDAHLCTVDADISTNGLTRLNFSSHRQFQ